MIDLIVFNIRSSRYALNIENVQKIIQATSLTDIPNAHNIIDGMMSHEDNVIKVLNFRKLIGVNTYDNELRELFTKLKDSHQDWIDELINAINNGLLFTKTINPNKCELGAWLNDFNSYDDNVTANLKNLIEKHKYLHISGGEVLELSKSDSEEAKKRVQTDINDAFNSTMSSLNYFITDLNVVANSLQKLILYENDSDIFAIKVDSIKDIIHIKESDIMNSENSHTINKYLELDGILDSNGVLINIIKTINLPN